MTDRPKPQRSDNWIRGIGLRSSPLYQLTGLYSKHVESFLDKFVGPIHPSVDIPAMVATACFHAMHEETRAKADLHYRALYETRPRVPDYDEPYIHERLVNFVGPLRNLFAVQGGQVSIHKPSLQIVTTPGTKDQFYELWKSQALSSEELQAYLEPFVGPLQPRRNIVREWVEAKIFETKSDTEREAFSNLPKDPPDGTTLPEEPEPR